MNEPVGGAAPIRRTPWDRLRASWPSNERGSVTVMVALTMTALLGMLALSIDLGALFNARSEAQRAADAAALAGASAFLEYQQGQARQAALERAVEYATANEIRSEPIAPEEVSVWVDLDKATVRAAIRRDGLATWFARLVGVDAVDIGAEATAWAGEAGAAQCVKPFAVPDMWEETTDDRNHNRIWDAGESWSYDPASGDRYAGFAGPGGSQSETGYGSAWRDGQVDAQGRRYDGDYGRRVTVKVTSPADAFVPSFFLPWVLPADGNQPACGSGTGGGNGGGGNGGGGNGNGGNGGGGGNGNGGGGTGGGGTGGTGGGGGSGSGEEPSDPGSGGGTFGWLKWTQKRGDLGAPDSPNPPGDDGDGGGSGGSGSGGTGGAGGTGSGGDVGRDGGSGRGAARYRQNICSCNSSIIDLDTEYLIEPGNMVGPTFQGVQSLIAQDPDAYWDEASNTVVSQYGMDSPRVVTVALFDPGAIDKPGRQYLRFNNFARIFIEEQVSRRDAVTGRFLYYVPGVGRGGDGQTTGSLVRVLQLIR